jgi:hypothetical protein
METTGIALRTEPTITRVRSTRRKRKITAKPGWPIGTRPGTTNTTIGITGRGDWAETTGSTRGSDDRYYCRRDDGTTGLIIGGISGAVLGHIIAPGGAKTLGTIVGAGTGALIGRAIDEGDVVCH